MIEIKIVDKHIEDEKLLAVEYNFVGIDFVLWAKKELSLPSNTPDGDLKELSKDSPEYTEAVNRGQDRWRKSASLSRRRFKIGISLYEIDGESLKTKIEGALESLTEPHKTIAKVSYEDGTEFDRTDDMTVLLAQEIGLTDQQVDDFFEWAMNEEWKNN